LLLLLSEKRVVACKYFQLVAGWFKSRSFIEGNVSEALVFIEGFSNGFLQVLDSGIFKNFYVLLVDGLFKTAVC
jgi:hypothetical protein